MKYIIKATEYTDETFNATNYEDVKLSKIQDSFTQAKHILDLDFENAVEDNLKIEFSGTVLTIYNANGTVTEEWIEKIA